MRYLVTAITLLALTGCGSLGESPVESAIGVSEEDNAIMCVSGSLSGSITNTQGNATRLEFPADMDLSELSPSEAMELLASCP